MGFMRSLEKSLKILANRRRLAILKYLKENRKAPVGEIAHEINLSFKATSKHLNNLFAVDVVQTEQKGLQIFYSLSSDQKPVVRYILNLL